MSSETPPNGYEVRALAEQDLPQLAKLLPELADFDVPVKRDPRHLWVEDLALAERVARNEAPASFCDVAVQQDRVHGAALVTLRPELLSQAPSAHLEALAVHPDARGQGLGRWLLAHAERVARAQGAESLTLHVFGRNQRARSLYVSNGYDEELIRAVKWL